LIATPTLVAVIAGALIVIALNRLEQRLSRSYWSLSQLIFGPELVQPSLLALRH